MDNEEKNTVETELEEETIIENSNPVEENTMENETNEEQSQEINTSTMEEPKKEENKPKKKCKSKLIIPIIITLVILILAAICMPVILKNRKATGKTITPTKKSSEYTMKGNSLEDFDLFFLKQENQEENKIYSPLSIKYALAMLADASSGDSKDQITSIIGDYKSKKYTNSEHLSLANAFFVKNSFKSNVKKKYNDLISKKYGAEVVYDDFASAKPMNDWISNKTLGLLKDMLQDSDVKELDFALINALAIDMEWKEMFLIHPHVGIHEGYANEKFSWSSGSDLSSIKFSNTKDISGMEIMASFNNYDIVKELGEDKIRETVENEYRKWLKDEENRKVLKENPDYLTWKNPNTGKEEPLDIDNEEDLKVYFKQYLDEYIKQLNSNFGKEKTTTQFELYTDDDVKVFAKDLKEYDGTTLQYVAIMPTSSELNTFVKNTSAKQINNYINSLKELKKGNFKQGVVTKIEGYIPKFKYEYELKLKEDLENIGIKDVFDDAKADLSGLGAPKGEFIATAKHKANIEFTEEGIKASASTVFGGLGSAHFGFYYDFDVPVETIDMAFDHPYMYIIRDKDTGEVWFTGTVYDPTLWDEDQAAVNYCKTCNYINDKNR